jgi:hypothetical protein
VILSTLDNEWILHPLYRDIITYGGKNKDRKRKSVLLETRGWWTKPENFGIDALL